jgi:hypothetical protein
MKNKVAFLIRYLLGAFFIFTGIVKLFPIATFEFTLVSQGITNWNFAPYLSRAIIALEIVLGIGLLQRSYLKRLVIPSTFLLLLVFSIHLVYQLITEGNKDDCGCFGQFLALSTLEGIIKNVFMMGILLFLFGSIPKNPKSKPIVPILVPVITILSLFLIFPVKKYEVVEKENDNDKSGEVVKIPSPYGKFKSFSYGIEDNLDKGIKLVALLSLDCDHCLEAASEIGVLQKEMLIPPTYFIFYGEEESVQPFFDEADMEVPYIILDAQTFFPLIKKAPPRVSLLENGYIIGEWTQETFDIDDLEKNMREAMEGST